MRKIVILAVFCASQNVMAKITKSKLPVIKTLCGVCSTSGNRMSQALESSLKVKQLTNGIGKLPLPVNLIVPAKLNDVHVSRYHLVLKVPAFSYGMPPATDWWGCAKGTILKSPGGGSQDYSNLDYGIFELSEPVKFDQSNGEAGME